MLREPRCVAGTHRDITEAKATRERLTESLQQLRALARRLQTVREEERAGIAREVHDVLGQEMTGLKMDVSWLATRLQRAADAAGGGDGDAEQAAGLADLIPPLLDKLQAMSQHIDVTIQNIRRISTELRPAVLDALGLVPALEWQAHDFTKRTGVPCDLVSNVEDIELDGERATAVFRIFQEALTNITRHAQATHVGVDLMAADDVIILTVQDDGVGMPKNMEGLQKSLGLLGMQERAMIFGGTVTVTGAPGEGTRVALRMPLT